MLGKHLERAIVCGSTPLLSFMNNGDKEPAWGEEGYIPTFPQDFVDALILDGPFEGEILEVYSPEMSDGELSEQKLYPFELAKFESIPGHKLKFGRHRWSKKEQGWRFVKAVEHDFDEFGIINLKKGKIEKIRRYKDGE